MTAQWVTDPSRTTHTHMCTHACAHAHTGKGFSFQIQQWQTVEEKTGKLQYIGQRSAGNPGFRVQW